MLPMLAPVGAHGHGHRSPAWPRIDLIKVGRPPSVFVGMTVERTGHVLGSTLHGSPPRGIYRALLRAGPAPCQGRSVRQ